MADQTIEGSAIADLVVQAIGSHSDALITLGTAICGGIVILIVDFKFKASQDVSINGVGAMVAAFILEGLSVVSGILVRGSLVDSIPALYGAQYKSTESLDHNQIDALFIINIFAFAQIILFLLGILALLIFVIRNWNTIASPN